MLCRSSSSIGRDRSMPVTRMPLATSGMATRPVPTANSRTGPEPASRARKSTVGPSTAGANFSAARSTYRAAASSSHRSLLLVIVRGLADQVLAAHHLGDPDRCERRRAVRGCRVILEHLQALTDGDGTGAVLGVLDPDLGQAMVHRPLQAIRRIL